MTKIVTALVILATASPAYAAPKAKKRPKISDFHVTAGIQSGTLVENASRNEVSRGFSIGVKTGKKFFIDARHSLSSTDKGHLRHGKYSVGVNLNNLYVMGGRSHISYAINVGRGKEYANHISVGYEARAAKWTGLGELTRVFGDDLSLEARYGVSYRPNNEWSYGIEVNHLVLGNHVPRKEVEFSGNIFNGIFLAIRDALVDSDTNTIHTGFMLKTRYHF